MFPNTRQVRLGPTTFHFHRDLSGEVALTPDDEPVLCQECSDDQVKGGVMQRLRVAPQSEQCRLCGRFSWGRVDSYQIREQRTSFAASPAAATRLLLDSLPPDALALIVEELTGILDQEGERLDDLGDPPVDPGDYENTTRRIVALAACKTIVRILQLDARAEGEGMAVLRELYGCVVEHARGYGDLSAPDAPFATLINRAAAFLGEPAPTS